MRLTDPTGHNWEDCGDRYSGYRCKIHMKHVQRAKAGRAVQAATQDTAGTQSAMASFAMARLYCSINPVACGGTAYGYESSGDGTSSTGTLCLDPTMCGGTAYHHGIGDPFKIRGGEYAEIFGFTIGNYASWDGVKQIDPADWEGLLGYVARQVDGSRFKIGWQDTPFFNGWGLLSGKACINGKCLDRSELNYVGEGEALAAAGYSLAQTHAIVYMWKNKGNYVLCIAVSQCHFREVSQGVKDMTEVGWYYYTEHASGLP